MELILDSNRNSLLALDLKVCTRLPGACRTTPMIMIDAHFTLPAGLYCDYGHRGRHPLGRPIRDERTYNEFNNLVTLLKCMGTRTHSPHSSQPGWRKA